MVWLSKLSSWWVVEVIFIALSLYSLTLSVLSLFLLLCLSFPSLLSPSVSLLLSPARQLCNKRNEEKTQSLTDAQDELLNGSVSTLSVSCDSLCHCECECGCACEWLPAIWIVKCAFEWLNRTIENCLAWAGWVSELVWAWLGLARSGWVWLGLGWLWLGLGWLWLGLGWVCLRLAGSGWL